MALYTFPMNIQLPSDDDVIADVQKRFLKPEVMHVYRSECQVEELQDSYFSVDGVCKDVHINICVRTEPGMQKEFLMHICMGKEGMMGDGSELDLIYAFKTFLPNLTLLQAMIVADFRQFMAGERHAGHDTLQ